jgi:hypothetical protein
MWAYGVLQMTNPNSCYSRFIADEELLGSPRPDLVVRCVINGLREKTGDVFKDGHIWVKRSEENQGSYITLFNGPIPVKRKRTLKHI